ncbi:MAG: hypothetical protein R3F19_28600 [Verrucomicrobiales bacterium]
MKTVRYVLSDFLPGLTFDSIDKEKGQLLFKTTGLWKYLMIILHR